MPSSRAVNGSSLCMGAHREVECFMRMCVELGVREGVQAQACDCVQKEGAGAA